MKTYEKISTIYQRNMTGSRELIQGAWCDQTVEYLKDLKWDWTEKVDGTNIRVHWDGHSVEFGGRNDKSQIPTLLSIRLNELFSGEENAQIFEQLFGGDDVILFGEGYGNRIQGCGGLYISDGVDFIMFDLCVNGNYQTRANVEKCAKAFGIKAVPIVGRGSLEDAVLFVKKNPRSFLGDLPMEGVVCRPLVELYDRCGNRLIVKIKYNDFKEANV